MSTTVRAPRSASWDGAAARRLVVGISAPAWGAIAVVVGFIGLTCWWLTQDRTIPVFDAGAHLETAIYLHHLVATGDLLGPFNYTSQYPPFAYLVGLLAISIGGVNVAAPIVGENLVFVPLLALGCYQTGKLLYSARAGLLATAFVLGSPLLIAQFHVFMLDAPETAMVAVSIWLLLASRKFAHTRYAALAGLAVGVGLITKVQFPFFVLGIVALALVRGGWRNWRGLASFVVIALVVGMPWYIDHISELGTITKLAGTSSGAVAGNLPPTFSSANLTWYFWSTLNSQLFVPLALLVLGGTVWTVAATVRERELRWPRLEFLVGLLVAWLSITLTPHHDIRYDMPLMPYLAVLGTGWVFELPRLATVAAVALLAFGVLANTLSTTFGVGGQAEVKLVASPPATEAGPDRLVFYSSRGFLVGGPKRDGDVPGLLSELRREGAQIVAFEAEQIEGADFSGEGLGPLVAIAGLSPSLQTALANRTPTAVTILHEPIRGGSPPACTTLSDGTGVWVLRLDRLSRTVRYYCPSRDPQYYS
jgi:Dolichyl-phosphate-mannose-protein mannosyltransferase